MSAGGWVAVGAATLATAGGAAAVAVYATSNSSGDTQRECECRDLEALGVELRNATKLQEAFRNKIGELRKMSPTASKAALQAFAGEVAKTVEPVPGYKGPKAVDYESWGDSQDPDQLSKYPNEKLCAFTDSAKKTLEAAKAGSACDGVGKALEAHEQYHMTTCVRAGYRAYLTMHGADRAQEEAEAYAAQIAVLKAAIARALKKNCPYKADGKTADVTWSGTICSLEKPFTVTGTNPLLQYPMKFVPTSAVGGTVSFQTQAPSISIEGKGTYTIEGVGTDKQRIAVNAMSTGHTPVGSRSGGGIVYIDLAPLEGDACK